MSFGHGYFPLPTESDRVTDQLQAGSREEDKDKSIKLSDNVTINLEDIRIQFEQLEFERALGQGRH